jgi:predicted DNA-binding transcriptional regulator YafY
MAIELERSPRTIARDIFFLKREMGAPIEYSPREHRYYFTDSDWEIPYWVSSRKDMLALIVGAKVLESIQGDPMSIKLRALPLDEFGSIEAAAERFMFRARPARSIRPDTWMTLALATAEKRVCHVCYHSPRRGASDTFRGYPYMMANIEGEWYVWVYHPKEKRLRQLIVAYIRRVDSGDDRFNLPGDFDADKLLKNTFGKYVHGAQAKTRKVVLLFDADIGHYIRDNQWHPEQRVSRYKPDGRTRLEFPYVSDNDLFYWILGFGGSVEVLKPKSLRNKIQKEIHRMRERYGDAG